MKGDFTRHTFDPKKRYSGVRLQQGRVGLDADFNEQAELDAFLRETALADVIGPCGVPIHDAESDTGGGFRIQVTDEGDLSIAPGHVYVDGLRVELTEDDVTYLDQPDFPGAELPTDMEEGGGAGLYLAYLDAWKHHRTALEDESIRELALGGPDTATRLRTVGQVKLLRVGDRDDGITCVTPRDMWNALLEPSLGRLEARTRPGTQPDDPCIVPSDAGYTRLENQLYRVEVHDGGGLGTATFKWSRENGSVVTSWDGQDDDELTVGTTGPDEVRGLAAGQWIELTDEARELREEPGLLVTIEEILGDDRILINPQGQTVDRADFPNGPKVRRWDMAEEDGALSIERDESENEGYLTLEGGIEVRFGEGLYRTGDFWWIPARAFVGDGNGKIEWPADETDATQPTALPPHGIHHHYCRLAVVEFDGEGFVGIASDCRPRFPSLGELVRITPAGGDGQEGLPGELLPCPLTVAVSNGRWPVEDARIRFEIRGDGGQVGGNDPASFGDRFVTTTNENGLARCLWILPGNALEPSAECFAVEARLVNADGVEIDTPPVIFHATTALARRVAYEPGCDLLEDVQAFTVQDALDALCDNLGGGPEEGIQVKEVLFSRGEPLLNDGVFTRENLAQGITVRLSEMIDDSIFQQPRILDPIFYVTLHLPLVTFTQRGTTAPLPFVFGFQPMILSGRAVSDGPELFLNPTPGARQWLLEDDTLVEQIQRAGRLLVRVTIKGNFVWSADDPSRFLDGDVFGEQADDRIGLRLPSGDERRGGDFEMWFWLQEPEPQTGLVLTAFGIVLATNRSIGGFVSDETGARLPGVTVTISGPAQRTGVTNADGTFTFSGLPAGTYTVRASLSGSTDVEQQVVLSSGPVIRRPNFDFTTENVPVFGIGRIFGGRLLDADIRNLEDLALTSPRRLAEVMEVSEDQARTFIARAVARLRGED